MVTVASRLLEMGEWFDRLIEELQLKVASA
jgi:hypothetical protein